MMLDYYLKQWIFRNMPKTFNVNGNAIHTKVRYANQYAAVDFPAVTLYYAPANIETVESLNKVRVMAKQTTDRIYKLSGDDTYRLVVDTPTAVLQCLAEINGEWKYIDKSTITLSNHYITFTGDKPDDETLFFITYSHDMLKIGKGAEMADELMVSVYAQDYKCGGGQKLPGIVVAEQITSQLYNWFKFQFNYREMNAIVESNVIELDTDLYTRREFVVQVRHTVLVNSTFYDIQTIDFDLEVET